MVKQARSPEGARDPQSMSVSAKHSIRSRILLPVALVALAVVAVLVWRLSAGADPANASVYYFDNVLGDDAAAGYSENTPRRSLSRISDLRLRPGDSVKLRAGSVWKETLVIDDSGIDGRPITIGSYGDGKPPRITAVRDCVIVNGDWVSITGVHVDGCEMAGFELRGKGDSVRHSRATRNAIGVWAADTSDGAVVARNYLGYNNHMYTLTRSPDWDDAGAFGVLLHGRGAEVGYNTIVGHSAFSYDFGRDGSAVEVYGATRSKIHHNKSHNNNTFIELGLKGTADNTISRNTITSNRPRQHGLVTRGGEERFGPVLRTTFTRNKLKMTGRQSVGFTCSAGCGRSILTLTYNRFDINGEGGFADRSPKMRGNRFVRGKLDIESRR